MAFYSQQCVDCTETTKQCLGEYHGKDESGKPFSGSMYTCENPACKINYERRKTQRYMQSVDMRRPSTEYDLASSTGENRRRSRFDK